jgi:hypothetical protein
LLTSKDYKVLSRDLRERDFFDAELESDLLTIRLMIEEDAREEESLLLAKLIAILLGGLSIPDH